jgi:VanZ family protein
MSLLSCAVLSARSWLKYWLPVLVCMGLIFLASSDSRSYQHSVQILGPIIRWLSPHVSAERLQAWIFAARKWAHVTEYAILAMLLWRALRKPGDSVNGWSWPAAGRIAFLAMLFAATDEFHQLFVPTRGASVVDVLIDTSGAVLGLLFVWVIGRWRQRW